MQLGLATWRRASSIRQMTAAKNDGTPNLERVLLQELVHHPYRTVAIAAGLGYLIGTRLGGPLFALLSSTAGLKLASSLVMPLLDPPGESR